MNSSSVKVLAGFCVLGTLSLGSAASAAPYLALDFQGDTVGLEPGIAGATASGVNVASGNLALVVDASSTPADPFGGAGNKSLFHEDDATDTDVRTWWQGAAGGLASGVFTAQIYMEDDGGSFDTPYVNIRLGQNSASSGSDIGVWLLLSHPALQGQVATQEPVINSAMDNALVFNTVNDLEITFDSTTDKYSGKLNGVALTSDGGTVTEWDYFTPLAAIDSVNFNTGFSSGVNNRVYFDNVVLDVPEPASMALLGAGLLVLCRRRR